MQNRIRWKNDKVKELNSQLKVQQPDKENTVLVKNSCVGIVIGNEQSEENKRGAEERRRRKEEEKGERACSNYVPLWDWASEKLQDAIILVLMMI